MDRVLLGLAATLVAAACSGEPAGVEATLTMSTCADVVDAVAEAQPDGTYDFEVTVLSGDTGWDKYADAWEVRGPGGAVLGSRELLHPHVDEQPFTRTLEGVLVPDGVPAVIVAARDSVEGFCGETLEVDLP